MSKKNGLFVIGCRFNTAEFIDKLLYDNIPLDGIVTLNRESARKASVPYWVDLKELFGKKIPVYVAEKYSLKSDTDKEYIGRINGNIGLCIGWQRLLPDWFLDSFKYGVFGMHACQYPLPKGKGRSPINWSLIGGAQTLWAQIIKYSDKPDTGGILKAPKLIIEEWDNVHTVQQKCRVAFNEVINENWEDLIAGNFNLMSPVKGVEESFYPKRKPEDGKICWSWSSREIFNWVRAQTMPYPGAFSIFKGQNYKVWDCVPFEIPLSVPIYPGQIYELFYDQTFLVGSGDGLVHVKNHEFPEDIKKGDLLE